jgi:toxin ParE1/3/4
MRITFSRRAQLDLDQIWTHVAQQSGSEKSATRLLDSIQKTCNLIRRSPNIGRKRDEDLCAGMRSHPSGNDLVFYRIRSGAVCVVRVLHGKRDIPKILRTQ